MIEIVADRYQGTYENPIPIGRQNENNTRTITFTCLKKFRQVFGVNGTFKLKVRKPGSNETYEPEDVYVDANGNACWDTHMSDLDAHGYGMVELIFYPKAGDVAKSKTWFTKIEESLI